MIYINGEFQKTPADFVTGFIQAIQFRLDDMDNDFESLEIDDDSFYGCHYEEMSESELMAHKMQWIEENCDSFMDFFNLDSKSKWWDHFMADDKVFKRVDNLFWNLLATQF